MVLRTPPSLEAARLAFEEDRHNFVGADGRLIAAGGPRHASQPSPRYFVWEAPAPVAAPPRPAPTPEHAERPGKRPPPGRGADGLRGSMRDLLLDPTRAEKTPPRAAAEPPFAWGGTWAPDAAVEDLAAPPPPEPSDDERCEPAAAPLPPPPPLDAPAKSDDDDYVLVGDDDYKPAIEVELKKRAERPRPKRLGAEKKKPAARRPRKAAAPPPPPSGPRFLVINRSGAIGAAPVRRQFAKKRDEVVRKQKKAVSRLAGGGGSPLVTRHFARPSPILENTRYPATSSSARYGTETKDEFGWPKAAGSPWRF